MDLNIIHFLGTLILIAILDLPRAGQDAKGGEPHRLHA